MKSRSRLFLPPVVLVLAAGGVILLGARARDAAAADSRTDVQSSAAIERIVAGSLSDRPLAAFRTELLELGFKTASALPVQPHVKNRSRAQEGVVAACLELDQPLRAAGYIEQIGNWRRGASYADLAFYCARKGVTAGVQHYLDLARANSASLTDERAQDWQRERIELKIARTKEWLEQQQRAARHATDSVGWQSNPPADAGAMSLSAGEFDQRLEQLDATVAANEFDPVRGALDACAELFDHFYDDTDRRALAEAKLKASWTKLPIVMRIELMIQLTNFSLEHADQKKALELLDETRAIVGSATWRPEDRVPLMARMGALRHRAGEHESARRDVDAALALFDAERDTIGSVYRAGALRPIAEAYQSMDASAAALAVVKRAVEEGANNPNSRPRAEDLSATCRSMALHAIEPDATLWQRMVEIHDGLGKPW